MLPIKATEHKEKGSRTKLDNKNIWEIYMEKYPTRTINNS